jgi:hypothetical protein
MQTKEIGIELKKHAPFTALGAVSGMFVMFFFQKLSKDAAYNVFYILHPIHVFLSALVTASIFKLHSCKSINKKCIKGKCNFWNLLIVGYVGSVGIATLSDCIIPYFAEVMLNMPHRHIHLGFIERWWLVNPLAIAGILVAFFWPKTKFPHAGHVLLSTWASIFHIIMAMGHQLTFTVYLIVLVFLFVAVWIPCCISDIIFPMLFVKTKK